MTPRGYALGKGHHESPVHRNPYDTHDAYDAIRTQDADLAVSHTITDLMRVIWFRLASVRKRSFRQMPFNCFKILSKSVYCL